jgi:hypothetical protein
MCVVQAKQRLQVENSGDVGTKYTLDVAALAPHFAAFPASGFLAPNQQAQVDITFHPRAIHPDIRLDKVSHPMHHLCVKCHALLALLDCLLDQRCCCQEVHCGHASWQLQRWHQTYAKHTSRF